ncbi:LytR C-terminal domain-containing protein [Prauserella flavalba]|uniref:LytR C-terminal domain-containing protein n=1 Tax=Prauserella flavalba TaxID=1477506 RepID=UPI0036ED4435
MSIFDGLSRPMRAAGLGLLAVALVAALVGGITLLTGNGESDETAQPTTSRAQPSPTGGNGTSRPGPTSGQASPSTTTGQPSAPGSATSRPGDTPVPGGNGDGDQGDGTDGGQSGDDQQAGVQQSVGVRVYNNSNIKGLASEAADDFRAQGWNVVQVANYPSGIIPTSTAYYRPGTGEEEAARALAAAFGLRVEPRFDGIKDSSAGVIVIVTMDYQGASKGK